MFLGSNLTLELLATIGWIGWYSKNFDLATIRSFIFGDTNIKASKCVLKSTLIFLCSIPISTHFNSELESSILY